MKTRLLALLFLFCCVFSAMIPEKAAADTKNAYAPVCLTVNGHYIKTEHPAYLQKGYTMVPFRTLSDALCADSIQWDEVSGKAVIIKDSVSVTITKNSKTALVNGKKTTLDSPAVIHNDRFYVPLRFVAEVFSADVAWNAESYTANITAKGVQVPASLIGSRGYSDEDLYWLSRIIHAESQGESMSGKIGVANVVLNRVKSTLFDNTIYDVVFDRKHGVQFSPIINGTIYNTPLGDSVIAAKRALKGENNIGESLYFLNPKIATNFWIVNNRSFYKTIGNHDFYL